MSIVPVDPPAELIAGVLSTASDTVEVPTVPIVMLPLEKTELLGALAVTVMGPVSPGGAAMVSGMESCTQVVPGVHGVCNITNLNIWYPVSDAPCQC